MTRESNVDIRPGRPDDAAAVVEFNRRLALETEQKVLDSAALAGGVARALADPSLCRYFIAEMNRVIVGQAMVTYEWSDWRNGVFWWLQSVYVSPEHRRRGVFRALHQGVVDAARGEPNVCGLRLYVETANQAAQETYRRLGMVASGHVVFEDDWRAPGTAQPS